jgi:hypothetical protein
MALYLLHFTIRLGGAGRIGAQHYLGWSTANELLYRIAEHQHGTANCAITEAVRQRGGGLVPVYVRWKGNRSEERYLKRNGHLSQWCPICHPEVRRYARPDEWYLPTPSGIAAEGLSRKLVQANAGDSPATSETLDAGWSPAGRLKKWRTGSRSAATVPPDGGGTCSPATVPPGQRGAT